MLYVLRGPHNPPLGWFFFAVVLGVYVRRVGPACKRYIHNTYRRPQAPWLLLRGGVSSRQWPAVVTDSPYDIATGQDRVQAAYLGGRGYLLRLVLLWWGQH